MLVMCVDLIFYVNFMYLNFVYANFLLFIAKNSNKNQKLENQKLIKREKRKILILFKKCKIRKRFEMRHTRIKG